MKSMTLNLKDAKKIKADEHSSTFELKGGHQMVIAHALLPALQRKQLERLPLHKYAEGGDVNSSPAKDTPDQILKAATNPPENETDQPPQEGDDNSGEGEYTPGAKALMDRIDNQDKPAVEVQSPDAPIVSNRNPSSPAPIPSSSQSNPAVPQSNPQTQAQAQMRGMEQEQKANLEGAKALGDQGTNEQKAYNDVNVEIGKLPTQSKIIADQKEQDNKLAKAYADNKLNPDHYWTNHSKIAAGIGVLISSLGQAMGATHGNVALQRIDEAIKQDIESQKNSADQKMNLWKMNREALGSDLAANLHTENQLYTGLQYKLAKAASEAKGPLALANAQAANARIEQAKDVNNFKFSLMNPTSDNPDPASRVQFLVPSERQQKVFDEIDSAKAKVAGAAGILEAFDKAAEEVRPLTGGTHTSLTAFVPGMKSPNQAALVARLGPTFKNVEGTVRQSAMDNMENNTVPKFGDSDKAIDTKRASLIQYLTSDEGYSTAKGFGIDLSKFPHTRTSAIGTPGGPGAPLKPSTVMRKDPKSGKIYKYILNPKTGKYE